MKQRPAMFHLFLMVLVLLNTSCGGSDDGPETPVEPDGVVEAVILSDSDNRGDASDFVVRFSVPLDQSDIEEYRVILVKAANSTSFDLSESQQVPGTSYLSVSPTDQEEVIRVTMPVGLLDADGDAIEEGSEFVAFVLSVGNVPNQASTRLSEPSESALLANVAVISTLVDRMNGSAGGIAIGPEGNIYVSDIGPLPFRGGRSVYKVTPEGDVSLFAFAKELDNPSGNTFGPDGVLYQSNWGTHTLTKISTEGTVTTFATQLLDNPNGVVFDDSENIFVANCGSNSITKIDREGNEWLYAYSELLSCPNGIAVDEDGILYVTNFGNGNILRVDTDGRVSFLTILDGSSNGHITYRNGVFYVVARGGGRIYTMNKFGNTTLLAGTGENTNQDGSPRSASFSFPNGLGFAPDGKSFYFNHAPTDGFLKSPSVIKKYVFRRR